MKSQAHFLIRSTAESGAAAVLVTAGAGLVTNGVGANALGNTSTSAPYRQGGSGGIGLGGNFHACDSAMVYTPPQVSPEAWLHLAINSVS